MARATLAVARARHGQALAVKAQNRQSRLSVGQALRAGLYPLPLGERVGVRGEGLDEGRFFLYPIPKRRNCLAIVVIDYGMGNLRSVSNALEKVGANVRVASDKKAICNADAIVLPGVGAFSKAMENLKNLKIITDIHEFIEKGRPFLGICLGFQLLFSESEEGAAPRGLDILQGKVKRFKNKLKVPHMGWNELTPEGEVPLLSNLSFPCFVYFAHSYYAEPQDTEIVAAITEYGREFPSMIQKNNIYGMQFHPEKSGEKGLKILRNFCNLI